MLAFTFYVLNKTYGIMPAQTEHEKQLLSTGVSAPARVVRILGTTGKKDDANWGMIYELEVQPEGKAPYTVEVTTSVLNHKSVDLVPNAEITVKYDPKNPSDVVIVQ